MTFRRTWVASAFAAPAIALVLTGCGGERIRTPPEPDPSAEVDPAILWLIREEGLARVRERPEDAEAWAYLGAIYDANLFDDLAVPCYEQSLALDDGAARTHFLLATLQERLGELDACARHLERAAALEPGSARIRRAMGEFALRRGRLDEAAAHAVAVDERSPGDPGAALLHARVALQQDETDRAITALLPLVERDVPVSYAHQLLAEAYRARGDHELERIHAALGRGETVPRHEPWLEALEALRPGLTAQLDKAYRDLNSGAVAAAIERLERLRVRYPDDVPLANALAQSYLKDRRIGDAVALMRSSVARHPNHVWALLNLARTELQDGQIAAASRTLERLFALDPDHSPGRELHGHLLASQLLLDEAAKEFEHAARAAPTKTSPLQWGGFVALDAARYQEALGFFDRALAIDPVHPECLGGRVLALQGLGRDDEAAAALAAADALPLHGFSRGRLRLLHDARGTLGGGR